jgi:redox-sensitive bicupin YhaK (pirin superfamily)
MSVSIKTLLTPRESDIGNLVVRRVLPARAARLVGPFIFFDEMGPAAASMCCRIRTSASRPSPTCSTVR